MTAIRKLLHIFSLLTRTNPASAPILARPSSNPHKRILFITSFSTCARVTHSHRKNVPSLRRFTPRTASNRLRQIAPRDFATFPEQMCANYYWTDDHEAVHIGPSRDPGWIDIFLVCWLPLRHYARCAARRVIFQFRKSRV